MSEAVEHMRKLFEGSDATTLRVIGTIEKYAKADNAEFSAAVNADVDRWYRERPPSETVNKAFGRLMLSLSDTIRKHVGSGASR